MGRSLDGAEVGLLRAHTLGNKRPRQIRPGWEFERLFAVGNEEPNTYGPEHFKHAIITERPAP